MSHKQFIAMLTITTYVLFYFKAILKDTQNKPTELKESLNIYIQTKKTCQDAKKSSRLPALREMSKETKNLLKPISKDPTESLGKLKLSDASIKKKGETIESKQSENLTPILPEDIEDIDAGDNNSPLLMSIYIKDIYNYLTELEEKYPIAYDHLSKQVGIH